VSCADRCFRTPELIKFIKNYEPNFELRSHIHKKINVNGIFFKLIANFLTVSYRIPGNFLIKRKKCRRSDTFILILTSIMPVPELLYIKLISFVNLIARKWSINTHIRLNSFNSAVERRQNIVVKLLTCQVLDNRQLIDAAEKTKMIEINTIRILNLRSIIIILRICKGKRNKHCSINVLAAPSQLR